LLKTIESIEGVRVEPEANLSRYTRFGIGGNAALLADAPTEAAFIQVWRACRNAGQEIAVVGGGTNLVVSDAGFPGVVLRFVGRSVAATGLRVRAESGAELQRLVDFTIERGMRGLETLTGIPGWVGAAIYGNAGAYGHSISERVRRVRFFDGDNARECTQDECAFAYRESVFKQHKERIIFSAEFEMDLGDALELASTAREIRKIRDAKYPPAMRCAGSIFKNCILAQLPPDAAAIVPANIVREGKIPSAWFLEQVGAKGMRRGGIQVAGYHANLIYNDGGGVAADLRAIILELKERVRARFGFSLEEEVQYLGFRE
jgi:UDP-N-acetylmuramate dehydrogenase